MNFVFVSLQRINTDRESTSTSLAKELAKEHKVLYVNSPIDRKTIYAADTDEYTRAHIQAIKSKEDPLEQVHDNLWVLNPGSVIESINWIPFTGLFSTVNWINNIRFANDIKAALTRLGFGKFILVNDKDMFRSYYLKEILKPEKYIYLDRDYTLGVDYWRKHGVTLEPKLMQKSDAVVCNSYDFTNRAKQYNPKSFYIGNGFDMERYNNDTAHPEPDDLKNIPGPRIGYVGALLKLRLNLELLIEMAKARPQWSFVFIGWEDEGFKNSELHGMSNVHFLGKKHTNEVPAYLEHFDVCINPQIVNDITRSNFPLKVVEYLAIGKPVVATATNTMNELFSEHTYLADNKDEFVQQIEKALAEDSPAMQQERLKFAGSFSWGNVVNLFMEAISEKDTVANIT
ncbi:glycosyltransferase [Pontibacter silvestris]|uniref:Glycosyltransferase n=1 Tax=Pontibacter silvestris TaxID=2305183 RepID=A0ABW4WXN4_9BACT|nr:glycosyltransferase [Pontibacter silvestris]MCC9138822.1 glycosyltransferase [Pontibacter silvestris]